MTNRRALVCTTVRAVMFCFAALLGRSTASAIEPILNVDAAALGAAPAASAVQGAQPGLLQRAVNLDGSLRESGLFGIGIAANPWSTDISPRRCDGNVRVDLGTY